MAQRVTQEIELVLGEGTPQHRVSQEVMLVLGDSNPKHRVSQLVMLVLADVPPGATPNPNLQIFVSPPS